MMEENKYLVNEKRSEENKSLVQIPSEQILGDKYLVNKYLGTYLVK